MTEKTSREDWIKSAQDHFRQSDKYIGKPVTYTNPDEVCLAMAFLAAKSMKGSTPTGTTACAQKENLSALVIGTQSDAASEEIINAVANMKQTLNANI